MTKCKKALINCAFYLIFAILAAAPVLADYTPPGGEGNDTLELGSSPATSVSIVAPDDITGWVLSPAGDGLNERVGILKVGADGDWQVTATDEDTTNTNGYMAEHDGSNYVTTNQKTLASPMRISVQSGGNVSTGYEVTLPNNNDDMIANGGSTGGASTMKDVDVTFKQPVSWGDSILTDGHKYQIVVTFTISAYP